MNEIEKIKAQCEDFRNLVMQGFNRFLMFTSNPFSERSAGSSEIAKTIEWAREKHEEKFLRMVDEGNYNG